MKPSLQKQAPVRLASKPYRHLREQVLGRDGWRCQICGSLTNLAVHHQRYRSHSGEDVEQNLITLCSECHTWQHIKLHRSRRGTDANSV